MGPILPGSTPSDTSAVFEIIKLINDPAKAKIRADELSALAQKANDDLTTARSLHERALTDRSEAEKALSAAQKLADDFNASHGARTSELNQKSAELSVREANVVARESQLAADVSNFEVRRSAKLTELNLREEKISESEGRLAEMEKELASRKTALDERQAKLAAAMA